MTVAPKGMDEKSVEFRKRGEVYVPERLTTVPN